MRAAIYARMSTDKQSADSPADQVARCREFAARHSWQLLPELVVEEAGISGASRHNRPGLLRLIACIDEWDVLLCWEFSRLTRDGEDLGWIRNRLRLHKRQAVEASTGLDVFNVGAKVMGVLNEEYLAKLAADTHRGLRGRAERKLWTGGRAYGYRLEDAGELGRGRRLVVDPAQADVVHRIFARYAAGEGLRTIAHALNVEGVPSPRGSGWAVSGLFELLRNPIYRGEFVWNRSEWIKDHETGRRRRIARPESEWICRRDESWRIVSDEAWEAVQRARDSKRATYTRNGGRFAGTRAGATHRVRSKQLLAGLLECGDCGGAFYALYSGAVYGCGWRRDRGGAFCDSALRVRREALEARIVGAIRDQVLTPATAAYAVERALERIEAELAGEDPEVLRARLAAVEAKIERAVDLAVEQGDLDAVQRKLRALRRERDELTAALRAAPPPFDREAFRAGVERRVLDLREAFAGAPDETRHALQVLLAGDRMRVHADPASAFAFRVEGLFRVSLNDEAPGASDPGGLSSVVAGGRLRPGLRILGIRGFELHGRVAA